MIKYCTLLISLLLIASCKDSRKAPNIDNINLSIKIKRFDNDLFGIPPDSISGKIHELSKKYTSFFELYNESIIGVGDSEDTAYVNNLKSFLNYKAVKIAREKVVKVFPDNKDLDRKLTEAFRYYKYYFPDKSIPEIITFISGFNQSIILADSTIGIGLDKYLGNDDPVYAELAIAKYLRRNMKKEKIPSDCMRAWAISEWPLDYNKVNLLSKMIYEGKLIYFTTCMLPNEPDSLIMGFTAAQMQWCNDYEKNMWSTLIEQKILYSGEHFNLVKLTEDAPYTSIFPTESPGKACNWIGYNIVKSYMRKNTDINLSTLMNTNEQTIFNQSKYKPKQ